MLRTILEKAAENITLKRYFEIDLIAIVAVIDIILYFGLSPINGKNTLFNFCDLGIYMNLFIWSSYFVFIISSIGFLIFKILELIASNVGKYNSQRVTWFWRAKLGNKTLSTRMFHYFILGNLILYIIDNVMLEGNISRITAQNQVANVYLTLWSLYLGVDLIKAIYFRHFHYTEIVEGLD